MLRNRRILLGIVALLSAAVLGIVFLARYKGRDRLYQGRPLSLWALQAASVDPSARDQASAVLRTMGSDAVPGLVRLLQAKDSAPTRLLLNLIKKLPPNWHFLFKSYLRKPNAVSLRSAAARSLGIIGPPAGAAAGALGLSLRDPIIEVRWDAATALGRIGSAALPVLLDALQSPDASIRLAVAHALDTMGPEAASAIPTLITALGDPSEGVRTLVINWFSKLGTNAIPELSRAIENGSGVGRKSAAQALMMISRVRSVAGPPLLAMLKDDDADARRQAIEYLIMIRANDEPTLAALRHRLDDPNPEVRLAAERALEQLKKRAY